MELSILISQDDIQHYIFFRIHAACSIAFEQAIALRSVADLVTVLAVTTHGCALDVDVMLKLLPIGRTVASPRTLQTTLAPISAPSSAVDVLATRQKSASCHARRCVGRAAGLDMS